MKKLTLVFALVIGMIGNAQEIYLITRTKAVEYVANGYQKVNEIKSKSISSDTITENRSFKIIIDNLMDPNSKSGCVILKQNGELAGQRIIQDLEQTGNVIMFAYDAFRYDEEITQKFRMNFNFSTSNDKSPIAYYFDTTDNTMHLIEFVEYSLQTLEYKTK
jgi:hypothetical protein